MTIFGLLLAVTSASLAVLAFEELGTGAALVVVVVMTLAGLAGAARRIPTALWWTIGAVIGGALGRWS